MRNGIGFRGIWSPRGAIRSVWTLVFVGGSVRGFGLLLAVVEFLCCTVWEGLFVLARVCE